MAAPANDNIANAQVLVPGTTQVTGDNTEATIESGEARAFGDGTGLTFAANKTVWFRWVAPSTAAATITTVGTTFDTYVTVYRTSGQTTLAAAYADLTAVASNDDGGGSGTSSVTFTPEYGRYYYIQVSGYGSSNFGAYTLNYPPPAGFSLFTSQTPTGTNNSDGSPGITTATSLIFAQAGTVNAIRFYATTTVSGTYTGALWQVTNNDDPGPGAGTLLASKVRGTAPTGGAWNLIVFDTPVAVTAGTLYRAGLHSSAGRYVNTASGLASGVTNGDISAPASGTDPVSIGTIRNGTFAINASLTYPATVSSASNYFIDVDFTPGGGGGGSTINGTATVTGAGSTSATATATLRATSTVTGAGSRTASAVVRAGSTVTGAGATTASAGGTVTGTSTVVGAGSRTAAAGIRSTATRTGAGSTAAAGRISAGATVTGSGVTAAAASAILRATSTVLGVGTTAANAGGTVTGSATVTGAGSTSAAGRNTGTATVLGAGSTTASARITATATVLGVGATSAGAGQIVNGTSTVTGVGYTVATAGSKITPRPFAGTTSRPYAGMTARP